MARVVHDEVEDHGDPAPVCLGHDTVEPPERSEDGIDAHVVGHVVADVEAGRGVDRREPQGVDAERARRPVVEMVEVGDDARQVAHAVPVAVGEAARVDLVDDTAPPPVVPEGRRRSRFRGLGHRPRASGALPTRRRPP